MCSNQNYSLYIRAHTLPWLTWQAQHVQGLLWRKTTCDVVVESAWAKNVHGWFMIHRWSMVILKWSKQKSENHFQLFATLRLEQPDSDEARCLWKTCKPQTISFILVGINIHRLPGCLRITVSILAGRCAHQHLICSTTCIITRTEWAACWERKSDTNRC